MKNSEEAIEKVLAGLRSSELPWGMERRILKSVKERSVVRSRWGWRGLRSMWHERPIDLAGVLPIASGVALASVLAGSLGTLLLHAPWLPSKQTTVGTTSTRALARPTAEAVARGAPVLPAQRAARTAAQTRARRVSPIEGSDSLARREMLAASMPAPPIPLTRQERLLLQVVHKADPEELAPLRSEVRAAQETASKAEFAIFFDPPTTTENKPIEP